MGRPREFDEDEVIDGALQAFWRCGYAATSIPDLLSATELGRGSLYKAFVDKHSLFELALERYLETWRRAMKQTLESAESPLLCIERWLQQINRGCGGDEGRPGCLAVNAMVELAPSDLAIRTRLARHWGMVTRRLAAHLSKAQSLGEVRKDVGSRQLADWLVRSITGIAVFARQGERENIVPTVLALLRR